MKATTTHRPHTATPSASTLWADLIAIEAAHPCYTVGSKLSWPKPLPHSPAARTAKAKTATRPQSRKRPPVPAA